jgi:hypothetical protein
MILIRSPPWLHREGDTPGAFFNAELFERLAPGLPPHLHSGCVKFQLTSLLLVLIAFAIPSFPVHTRTTQQKNKIALTAELEENKGSFRIFLTNNSEAEFHGRLVIGIGTDSEQPEIGQIPLDLPGLDSRLLQLAGASRAGSHYLLRIFDANNAPVFFRIAPIKTVSDDTPAQIVRLFPMNAQSLVEGNEIRPAEASRAAPTRNEKAAAPVAAITDVVIKTKLLAGESENDPFKVLFEISSPHPINDASLAIALGEFKDRRAVNLVSDQSIEIKLPDEVNSDRITYRLLARDGRELAKGEVKLENLMAEDYVNVSEIRTDKGDYAFGDIAKITVLLDGRSPHGYRLEVSARDANGAIVFSDQRQCKPDRHEATQEFMIVLPRTGEAPLMFEFKIYDGETGLLFDSGEREIPVTKGGKP